MARPSCAVSHVFTFCLCKMAQEKEMLSTTDYKRQYTHEKRKYFMSPLLCFLNNAVVIATLELAWCLLAFHGP